MNTTGPMDLMFAQMNMNTITARTQSDLIRSRFLNLNISNAELLEEFMAIANNPDTPPAVLNAYQTAFDERNNLIVLITNVLRAFSEAIRAIVANIRNG